MPETTSHNPHRPAGKGFRIVGFIIAVVIAVLAIVALPNYLSFRKKVEMASFKEHLGTIRSAQVAYYAKRGKWITDLALIDFERDERCEYKMTPGEEGFIVTVECDMTGDGNIEDPTGWSS